jgi:MFS family permease
MTGIVYFITIWYQYNERAVRIALVVAFCNLAGAFGGAIAYGVGHINGSAGLQGFRWLFIIEGIITIASAFLLIFFLPDYPARARWLSEADKRFAEDRLVERGGGYNRDHASKREVRETFLSPRMLAHYIAYVSQCRGGMKSNQSLNATRRLPTSSLKAVSRSSRQRSSRVSDTPRSKLNS